MADDKKVATFDELFHTIQKTLNKNGTSEKIKASIRAQVYSCLTNNYSNDMINSTSATSLNDGGNVNKGVMNDSLLCNKVGKMSKNPTTTTAPSTKEEIINQPRENLLINEMIHEYLIFNGCAHTASVFQTELGVIKGSDINITTASGTTLDQGSSELDRAIIGYELGLNTASHISINSYTTTMNDTEKKHNVVIPMLYRIISSLKKLKQMRMKEHENKELMFYDRAKFNDAPKSK